MNPWFLLAAVLALGTLTGGAYLLGTRDGSASVQAEWDQDKARLVQSAFDASERARATEAALRQQKDEAQRNGQIEKDRSARVASRLRTERDSLRNDLAAYASGAADDTLGACRDRATALGVVLARALRTAEICAGHAETASSDVRTLRRAWPVDQAAPGAGQ